ncbi:unnamed protein product [Pieris macdunnoughi]|uniref:Uncharacterized protein n=1 Tax=Pieris macdunnoughi TaxID=345717 RepID=A0A821KX78_9NEOP|nr:unnamed protein product [Pieris macdunnoughi]
MSRKFKYLYTIQLPSQWHQNFDDGERLAYQATGGEGQTDQRQGISGKTVTESAQLVDHRHQAQYTCIKIRYIPCTETYPIQKNRDLAIQHTKLMELTRI